MIIHVDGGLTAGSEIPVNEGSFLFGDTLFETLLARGERLRFASDHLDRMEFSASLLEFPFDRRKAEEALQAVAGRLSTPSSRLRLTLTRGGFDGLFFPPPERARQILTAAPYCEPTDSERKAGVACVLAPNRRVNPLSHLPQMKRGNYADCLYAADHARRLGAREALFITEDGRVIEGATTNLFLLRDGILVTPPAGDLVLPGILRRQVIKAAARLAIPCREREILLPEVYEAEEAFLTNALIGVLPVATVENRPLSRGPLGLKLLAQVEQNV